MGSGPSTHVKSLENKPNTTSVDVDRHSVNAETLNTSSTVTRQSSTVGVAKPVSNDLQTSVNPPMSSKLKKQVSASQTGLEQQLEQLKKELGESESEKLDLQDRIQALEECIQELMSHQAESTENGSNADKQATGSFTNLQETLKAKDLYIKQMAKQLENAQTESSKVRARLKKKIKTLTQQLNEVKQENSISQLELKERNAELQDQLQHMGHGGENAMAAAEPGDEDKDSKFKVILDLSAEVSDQANRILSLERKLKEKDSEIKQLKQDAVQASCKIVKPINPDGHNLQKEPSQRSQFQTSIHGQNARHSKMSVPGARSTVTPVESGADYNGMLSSQQQGRRPISKIGPRTSHRTDLQLTLQRQSTALSDSDSDWEVDMSSAKIHSAPAGVRVKSAATIVKENCDNPDVQDKWSLATDDNDLTFTSESRPIHSNSSKKKRKSALKTKLERERNERAKGLMGPSLAFAAPAGDQLTDTSCNNTPTPGRSDLHGNFSTTEMTFAV